MGRRAAKDGVLIPPELQVSMIRVHVVLRNHFRDSSPGLSLGRTPSCWHIAAVMANITSVTTGSPLGE